MTRLIYALCPGGDEDDDALDDNMHYMLDTKPDDYWVGLSYLMHKHQPQTLAEVMHLVSVVEYYLAQHCEGDLSRQLKDD